MGGHGQAHGAFAPCQPVRRQAAEQHLRPPPHVRARAVSPRCGRRTTRHDQATAPCTRRPKWAFLDAERSFVGRGDHDLEISKHIVEVPDAGLLPGGSSGSVHSQRTADATTPRGSDVVDAHVVFLGAALSQRVLTGDPGDLEIIATAMSRSQPDILAWD
jgi:hypothetical protein